jgi:hypothetical protein
MADEFGELKGLMDAAEKAHVSFVALAKKTVAEIKTT